VTCIVQGEAEIGAGCCRSYEEDDKEDDEGRSHGLLRLRCPVFETRLAEVNQEEGVGG
jgi:hypothetical protein